jgi:hypothetical protein
LNQAMADWKRKPDAKQTVANTVSYFKRENAHRLDEQKALKRVLTANKAITNQRPTKTSTVTVVFIGFGWGYCWTHRARDQLKAPTLQRWRAGKVEGTLFGAKETSATPDATTRPVRNESEGYLN